jgi:hypothetical protein
MTVRRTTRWRQTQRDYCHVEKEKGSPLYYNFRNLLPSYVSVVEIEAICLKKWKSDSYPGSFYCHNPCVRACARAMFLSEFFTLAHSAQYCQITFGALNCHPRDDKSIAGLIAAAQIQGHCLDTSEAKTAPQ